MESLSDLNGYVASSLVLLTFLVKDMRLLRTVAIFSNLAFITYGTIEWLPPVLFLHLVLLPLNIVRLAEAIRTAGTTNDRILGDSAVRVQTLCTHAPTRDKPAVAPQPISLTTPNSPVRTMRLA